MRVRDLIKKVNSLNCGRRKNHGESYKVYQFDLNRLSSLYNSCYVKVPKDKYISRGVDQKA